KELHARLKNRALDSDEVIERRLKNARIEIEHWAEYDYVLLNDDLAKTSNEVANILKTSRLARIRQNGLASFIKKLQIEIDEI
ncbi:MAG: guanylate kinase, partial [Devosiaceae bacterium]|nr:guanylate kinase [Devosiaceae bacterium]